MSGEEQCAISTLPTGNSGNEMVFSDQFLNIKSGKHGTHRIGGRLIDVYSHGSKRPICQNVSCEKLTIYSLEPIHEVHHFSANNMHICVGREL